MNNLIKIKKNFNFLIEILRIFKNQLDKLNKCRLYLLYGFKYGILNKKKLIKIILNLITNNFNPENLESSCLVKPSKIIFDKKDKDFFIFDRPIPDFYFDLRDKFGHYHQTPSYLKIDKKSYLQDKAIYNRNLFSLSKSDQFHLIKSYLDRQLELKKNYGVKVSLLQFLEVPLSFLQNREKQDDFPFLFRDRINSIKKRDESLILVPSVIEPWPIIKDDIMFFYDLSPVEFREAPFLHDLLYMLFKYELYGNRLNNNNTILPIIFNALKKIDNGQEKEIKEIGLLNLVKLMHKVVNPKQLIDAYIIMIVFHSYVKFEATGRFMNSSAKRRFDLAIVRHAKIFELITC